MEAAGLSSPTRPRARRRGRRPPLSTPARLGAYAIAAGLVVAVLATVIVVATGGQRDGLREIGEVDAPEVSAASDLYFALNDMDAQLANILLVGDAQDLGFTAAQARAIFEQRRAQADRDLQQAATAATDPATAAAIRTVLDAYGTYLGLASRTLTLDGLAPHPPGTPDAATLVAYRQAVDLLDGTLLPVAGALTDRDGAALQDTYRRQHDAAIRMSLVVPALGAIAVLLLIALQVFLARRFHRRINPGVAAATLLCVVLATADGSLFATEANHLRVAKKDAFDSILALEQARAISYDANADESRYLVDPQRADQYQSAFLAKTQRLLDLPGATVASYDQQLDAAVTAYRADHADVGWHGFYGTEFRNITFTGERDAAENVLALFQTYQRDDRQIRTLAGGGQLPAAIAFCTSYQPGRSNYAFDRYDTALAALIAINQAAFTGALADAGNDLDGWTLIPWLGLAGCGLFIAGGTRRRFAEYG